PDWTALPPEVPPALRTLIKRCLEKDRRARIPDLAVVRFLMADSGAADALSLSGSRASTAIVESRPHRGTLVPWLVAAGFALGLVGVVILWSPWRAAVSPRPIHISAEVGANASLLTVVGAGA